ncbi:lysis protein [Pseudescherichia vulneris]|uniref:lysis protein n=1 Tax=Pseudescherichia vulneris TaxID=566 RepID=UPI001EDE70A5|nr:lysis protein [Pseudescherichia vulneris]
MKFSQVVLLLLCELLLSLLVVWHLTGKIADEQQRADAAEHNLQLAKDTIDDMQTRQRDVAALDAKYTGELADAQETIDQLERDVAAGRKRLRLNATCTANGTASATSMDDGSGPRLTDAAERDYYTLRRRIETITSQLTGLQAYVREQCLK